MILPMNLTGSGEPERLSASVITGNYFDTFRVRPALGRGFSLENEKTGQDHVTVLSHAFWQTRFGGDPNIVNKTIILNGKAYEVLGVMPAEVVLPQDAQLWVPLNFDADPEMKMRNARFLLSIGTLKEGVTLAQAQADTDLIAAQLEQQYPDQTRLEPASHSFARDTRGWEPKNALYSFRRCWFCVADRLRQRGKSVAGPCCCQAERDCGANGT